MQTNLSVRDTSPSAPGSSTSPHDGMPSPCPVTVLVVDDEIIIADTIVQILNRAGFLANAVYNGRDAIESARRNNPHTVLSDVMMPLIDGVEAAIAIRALWPATRIVLFSGQAATVEILDRARAQGYDFELLPKPIHPTELLRYLSATA